jgi:hypothetical protein
MRCSERRRAIAIAIAALMIPAAAEGGISLEPFAAVRIWLARMRDYRTTWIYPDRLIHYTTLHLCRPLASI